MIITYPLGPYGQKVFSQYDEDGIIAELIRILNPAKYFVEIGAHETESNCMLLYKNSWHGVFIDASGDDKIIKKHHVTPSNVNDLIGRYVIAPYDFGMLSIDVDGQDIYIWRAIRIRPAIVVIEYNPHIPAHMSVAVPEDVNYVWDGTLWYGASLLALTRVSTRKGYILVHANNQNAFFVRSDLVSNPTDFDYDKIYDAVPHPPDNFMGHHFVEIE